MRSRSPGSPAQHRRPPGKRRTQRHTSRRARATLLSKTPLARCWTAGRTAQHCSSTRRWASPHGTAYVAVWPDPGEVPADRRNLLLLLIGDAVHQRLLPGWKPVAKDLYRHFRTRADHLPQAAPIQQLTAHLYALRPDLTHWWACRSVGDFAPRTIELVPDRNSGPPRRYAMTLLLTTGPGPHHNAAILVQSPIARGAPAP
ncbi:hypothetical protein [Streptomyces sp. ISL-100]|uniref:MmyB family transcriptional regulator n=1 Tax=Streptomyces sp. ISL-100 TaxID=2819173 RepID=UPI001BE6D372|nr:hypothetical protein [Streptomyces sp. ISL-100]MBT2395688.1 hypothetical protein [Streptomyces sp. ISL-100]